MNNTSDLVLRSFVYNESCGCPDCVAQRTPRWPCGRPRRHWDTPVPMPLDYPPNWPQYTSGRAVASGDTHQAMNNSSPMSGTGATQLCN